MSGLVTDDIPKIMSKGSKLLFALLEGYTMYVVILPGVMRNYFTFIMPSAERKLLLFFGFMQIC